MIKREQIFITGQVQGVGFRPAVYRLAHANGLSGFVYNDTKGVTIELQGQQKQIDSFLRQLRTTGKPPLATIQTCNNTNIEIVANEKDFTIKKSDYEGTALSQVTADMTICKDCLSEMGAQDDFRYRYPFINCTNCGPRYSIVKTIPYDRPNTTMSVFEMCKICDKQYRNAADRRFHAQPVACPKCGPKIWLTDNKGETIQTGTDAVVRQAAKMLKGGKILAIKGIGGFHLAVDALNEKAVKKLRRRKRRDHKPFALMADSIEQIKKHAIVSDLALQLLESPQSPIVLLDKKQDSTIANSAAEGVSTFGFMLCYAPLHFLLFAEGLEVLVMTSGNLSDEPLICKNDIALERLGDIADAFVMHDREIYRQVDDSIVHLIDDEPVLLRRSRGYVPTPILNKHNCPTEIFAAGADLKNTFCFVKQNQLICSEHIGDMEDAEVYHHYVNSVEHLRELFEVEPQLAVCDLHPGYLSTRYGLSKTDIKTMQVQHHWAHIASVLAEHNLSGPVIGLACDGTGYGSDGAVWGCECLIASLERFERFGHLGYYKLAGGDKASKEAVRPLLGLLMKAYGKDFSLDKFSWLLEQIEPDKDKLQIIAQQLEKNINTVQTSSLGRVFDAVSAMIGLGSYNNFEAQLPMALEAIAQADVDESYDFELLSEPGQPILLDLSEMLKQIIADIKGDIESSVISAKFHNCLVDALLATAQMARQQSQLNTVALSGGVFCNRYLANHLIKALKNSDFSVLFNRIVPSNDGGISLGQAAIASSK